MALLLAGCRDRREVPCDYAQPSCDPDRVCARVDGSGSACILFATEARPVLSPFPPAQSFWCSQGPRSPAGRSHSFGSDVYAVDLVSPLGSAASPIVAPVDGDAYVFDGCEERDASPAARNDSRCGLGYGNHVKIWDGTNIHLLGHLSRVVIQRGRVKAGQIVGIEGVSGAAGHRHVHLTVTRPGPRDDVQQLLSTPGHKGRISVRFQMRLRGDASAVASALWVDELQCHDDVARTRSYLQL